MSQHPVLGGTPQKDFCGNPKEVPFSNISWQFADFVGLWAVWDAPWKKKWMANAFQVDFYRFLEDFWANLVNCFGDFVSVS